MSGYYIYASLQEGRPALQVVDADSHDTCLNWQCSCMGTHCHSDAAEQDIQDLFRRLMLLTCRQNLKTIGQHTYYFQTQKPRKVA